MPLINLGSEGTGGRAWRHQRGPVAMATAPRRPSLHLPGQREGSDVIGRRGAGAPIPAIETEREGRSHWAGGRCDWLEPCCVLAAGRGRPRARAGGR